MLNERSASKWLPETPDGISSHAPREDFLEYLVGCTNERSHLIGEAKKWEARELI